MKTVIFSAILLLGGQFSFAYPNSPILSASVVDQDCRSYGDWKSDAYQELHAKLLSQANERCRKNGMSATLDYIYESVVCEDSILNADANFHCWW